MPECQRRLVDILRAGLMQERYNPPVVREGRSRRMIASAVGLTSPVGVGEASAQAQGLGILGARSDLVSL
jgi:hypothetical protein